MKYYLIEHEKTGVLVPPNDEKVFVNAITELISNSDKTKALSNNARIKVESFDWEVVKGLWNEVLRSE